MTNKIICIGREFGSGGHEIAVMLGKALNISVYDKEILELACNYGSIRPKLLRRSDERATNPYLYTTIHEGNRHVHMGKPAEEVLFDLQSHEICRLADSESCIFVGRCADFVLRNAQVKLLRVFISAPLEQRINRKMEQENWSIRKARHMILRTDAHRKKYYEHNTGQIWGEGGCYDLFLDTGEIGFSEAVHQIVQRYKALELDQA